MVLPLILTVDLTVMAVCFGLAILHPIYMFLRINKVQATNILVRFCFGVVLATGFSSSFAFQYAIGLGTATNFQGEIFDEQILAENIVGTYGDSTARIKFLENGTTETYDDDTKSAEGEWKVVGSEVLVLDLSGGKEVIIVFKVNLNGDLILSAVISDEQREEIPLDKQRTIKKIE
jgi:hypothetical protein